MERNKIRVMLAEAQMDLCLALTTYINSKDDMAVVGCAHQGLDACRQIDTLCPDVAVIAVIMPVLDGLGVLEKYKCQKGLSTKFIVTSKLKNPVFADECMNLGAHYYMLKPIDMETLTKRIRLVAGFSKEKEAVPQASKNKSATDHAVHGIAKLLLDFGIPSHLNGYHYLREAITMVLRNVDYACRVTKVLYPELAKKFNSTEDRVERSIRSAIGHAWSCKNGVLNQAYTNKPTNRQVLSWAVETLRLEENVPTVGK